MRQPVLQTLPHPPMAGPFIIPQGADFFEELKMDRDKTRSREEEVLQKLIDDSNTHPDVYRRARRPPLPGRAGAPGGGSGEHDTGTGIRTSCCLPVGSGASVVVKSADLKRRRFGA